MLYAFADLPIGINSKIENLLSENNKDLLEKSRDLHFRYLNQDKKGSSLYVNNSDVLSYLNLRVPATYAQIFSALSLVKEMLPSFRPVSLLDLGSGPGTGIWAAESLWPGFSRIKAVDKLNSFLSLGRYLYPSSFVSWEKKDILKYSFQEDYDLVLIANVLNELSLEERRSLLFKLSSVKGLIVLIEPGTSSGVRIIDESAKYLSKNMNLIAPYISNSYVAHPDKWIHFSQRFNRPVYQKRIRQFLRTKEKTSSGIEDAKYAFTALSKSLTGEEIWGRVIGKIEKYKGYLNVPILTSGEITDIKVLKRNRKEYAFAKDLVWGDAIKYKSCISP